MSVGRVARYAVFPGFLFVYYIWYRFVGGVSIFGWVVFVLWVGRLIGLYVFCFWCMVVVYVVDKGAAAVLAVSRFLEFCYECCFCLWLCCFSC